MARINPKRASRAIDDAAGTGRTDRTDSPFSDRSTPDVTGIGEGLAESYLPGRSAGADAAPPPDQIAARAYAIWEAKGRPTGEDDGHWRQAESELRGGRST